MDTMDLFKTAQVMRDILQDTTREYRYDYVSTPTINLEPYGGTPEIQISVDDYSYENITIRGNNTKKLWTDFYARFKTKQQRGRDNLIEKLVALETASEKVEGIIAENMLADILKPLKEARKMLTDQT